ncbi:MAG TPA: preprotein translocase subunit SecA [Nitrospirales bacterium]|nr:preprotein translocase subunit SecA [Nitrospirales bacterium]
MTALLNQIFGSKNDRELQRLWPRVTHIASLEEQVSSLSDGALRAKTDEFKGRLSQGEGMDDILPDVFAVGREMSTRTLGMRHFDVQILGGIVLHEGKISEMKTGEGKTLVATLPLYLNALAGQGAHLVTVNDYLAKRDAQWMGVLYSALGLSLGVIQHEASFLFDPSYESPDPRLQSLRPVSRTEAYRADITYGTNNEYGFDYLRDNMVVDVLHRNQPTPNFAIVDEVDSILIDESRTPLIISGPTEESTDLYYRLDKIIPHLKANEDYTIEEKTKTASLTEEGNAKAERLLGVDNLYDLANINLVHHLVQALRAHTLYHRDTDYVVNDGAVTIVDEFTGRLMPGRRWSDGLHQAVEAKENVKIANENQTLASVTFQNYFRMYHTLAGMTGTADTEAAEFAKIYNLEVVVAPTNKPMIRVDFSDVIYRTEKEKYTAIVEDIIDCAHRQQPVLVGTISIEKSETISAMLKKQGVKHSVLNAKFHEKEAEIIAQAGGKGAVTIATNMAGRGTDIVLGGNPEFLFKQVVAQYPDFSQEERDRRLEQIQHDCDAEKQEVLVAGGLHIVGTERHESRRIDNQLRGRTGRQGDPGSSRFYLSLEDDLLRIFGSERISSIMEKLGMEEGIPIEHKMITRSIENAQKKVEAHHFDTRKQLLEYDDVMNKQREVIYERRHDILSGHELKEEINASIEEVVDGMLSIHCDEEQYVEAWDLDGLADVCKSQFAVNIRENEGENSNNLRDMGRDALREQILEQVHEAYRQKEEDIGPEMFRHAEKMVMLQVIDAQWKDHLLGMDHLKEGIGLRGYGQKDPLVEYKREGFEMFANLMTRMKSEVLERLIRVQLVKGEPPPTLQAARRTPTHLSRGESEPQAQTVRREGVKVGRNEPCPCGSGKKYKKCHGT